MMNKKRIIMRNKLILIVGVLLAGLWTFANSNILLEGNFKSGKTSSGFRLRAKSKIDNDSVAGANVMMNSEEYSVAYIVVNLNSGFKLTVNCARGEQGACSLGAIVYRMVNKKWKSVKNIGWHRSLSPIYRDIVFKASWDKLNKKRGTYMIMLFRSRKKGLLKIKSWKVERWKASSPTKPLKKKALNISMPPKILNFKGNSKRLEFFPLGVYATARLNELKSAADAENTTPANIRNKLFAEIKELGANTVYFAELLAEKNKLPAAEAAEAADRYGLKPIIQMNDVYYRGDHSILIKKRKCKNSWEHFKKYIEPRVRKYLPKYQNSKVWAWSPIEEPWLIDIQEVAEYYKIIWKLTPNINIFLLENKNEPLIHIRKPLPTFFGVDRYFFTNIGGWNNRTLVTPQKSLSLLRGSIRSFMREAENKGRPMVLVLQGTAMHNFVSAGKVAPWLKTPEQKKEFSIPEAPGLKYYPNVDKFGYWGLYTPPRHALRAQCWTGILEGAKGLFAWSYKYNYAGYYKDVAKKIKERKSWGISISLNRSQKNWRDLQTAFREIKPFGKLLLNLKRHKPIKNISADKHIWASSAEDSKGRKFLLIMNSHISNWDKNNPRSLDWPKTKLNINEHGELINYVPAAAKTFIFSPPSGKLAAFDSKIKLEKTTAGKYRMTLEPGQGTVLYLGDEGHLAQIKKTIFRKTVKR